MSYPFDLQRRHPDAIMELHNVACAYYSEFAVRNITMEFKASQITAVLGHNGSGKTTIFNMCSPMVFPVEGHIFLQGRNRHVYRHELADQMYYLPFGLPDFDFKTPYDLWRFTGRLYGLDKKTLKERIIRLSFELEIYDEMYTPFAELSLGYRQRARLVAAFLPKVPLRILDEPFSGGLDPIAIETVMRWMEKARGEGEAIVFSSQVIEQAGRLADYLHVISNGRTVAHGNQDAIIAAAGLNPEAPRALVQAYLALSHR